MFKLRFTLADQLISCKLKTILLLKVKALEKIANVLDALTLWFEDIDKEEWSNRIQWYLAEYYEKYGKKEDK